jgi:hypothetical protein
MEMRRIVLRSFKSIFRPVVPCMRGMRAEMAMVQKGAGAAAQVLKVNLEPV